ncbi:hypothetical protein [Dysosmobacter sp.]|uniref:hypothetical protein n=1 Tax=Dysosmobacter sp. TaxID=2591382 RepID=UPI002A858D29|nr:hypothetical protein [Dysosmobacter sp.]MDY3985076.1 hypothetical protein [Dysosmobacter sp.]
MDEQMCFLQALAKFMDREGISCSFDCLPRLDRPFWDNILQEQKTEDRKTLEQIAALLRENTSDFHCIDKILLLVERRGFDTFPRHDF